MLLSRLRHSSGHHAYRPSLDMWVMLWVLLGLECIAFICLYSKI
jgi:hypothetical protein